MDLRIKVVEKQDYVYLVDLKGPLDSETYPQLEKELKGVISDKTKAVILDMAGVDYVSSAGIGVVMWARNTLEKQYATLVLINLQPKIKKIFDVMKLLPVMMIFQDMPEAHKYIDQIISEEMEKENG